MLGTFANYYRQPCDPTPQDMEWVKIVTRTAAIAIERARAEAALRRLTETLERQLEERSRALNAEVAERQKIEAALHHSQRLEAIGRLTGGIAHDFNNLLTVILGQAEAIAETAEDNPRIARMADAAIRAAERGAQLTGQLLSFAGRQQLRPAAIAVDRLIGGIGDFLRRAVGETIAVDIAADPALWPSFIDPAQFEAAILNLVINARDAMPQGGRLSITLRNAVVAREEAGRLDLKPGEYVVASVADTGVGMTPEVRRRAFEPFFTTKDIGKGTGLGLAQLYGFARQSGGTATLASAPDAGTTVSLYLPRAATAAEKPAAARPATTVSGAGRAVLLVEDQPDVREVIALYLGDLGYRVLI
ncbi:MAG: ATP-binding protein, partial [Stellaceae bacterium]